MWITFVENLWKNKFAKKEKMILLCFHNQQNKIVSNIKKLILNIEKNEYYKIIII